MAEHPMTNKIDLSKLRNYGTSASFSGNEIAALLTLAEAAMRWRATVGLLPVARKEWPEVGDLLDAADRFTIGGNDSSPSPHTIGQVSIRLEKANLPDLDWEF